MDEQEGKTFLNIKSMEQKQQKGMLSWKNRKGEEQEERERENGTKMKKKENRKEVIEKGCSN